MGTAMLTIMAAFAQLERDTMIERTRAGLAAAAANGRKGGREGGRPRKVDDADAAKARQLRAKGITASDIAKMLESPAPPRTGTSTRKAPPDPCQPWCPAWRRQHRAAQTRATTVTGAVCSAPLSSAMLARPHLTWPHHLARVP